MKGEVAEVMDMLPGISYRQLDYWVRAGYLHPDHTYPPKNAEYGYAGSGHARQWPNAELEVARTMARLVKAGLTPAVAAQVARGESQIAPGVWVVIA